MGEQPHCNAFLRAEQLGEAEPHWPLELLFCEQCHLVQLSYVVDRELMFRDYVYVSGTTATLNEHFCRSAEKLVAAFELPAQSLVVDIGSNDGTFLQHFKALGMRVLGVDPATNIARMASERGIETINDFFSEAVAERIREKHGPARLITAAGVFFHIDDMDDVCRGVRALLDEQGVVHVQAIYLGSMLEQTSFDNVYHEHLSYYTLAPLIYLFARFDLDVFDVGRSPIHGGTLLVYACKRGAYPVRPSVERQLAYERAMAWHTAEPYREFACRAEAMRRDLVQMLRELKAQGKRIAAYSAPAKGNTLLNYCQIGTDILDYAAEKNPLKVGLYTPGMHVPVIAEAEAMANPPDYFLLLAWNFKDELLEKNRAYRERGGKFIVPIPTPHVV